MIRVSQIQGARRGAILVLAGLALSACGSTAVPGAGQTVGSTAPAQGTHAGETHAGENHSGEAHTGESHAEGEHGDEPAATEVAAPQPRLAISHEAGVDIVDGSTLKVIETLPTSGFVRLNPAGDGRHVLVTEGEKWRVLDLGSWTQAHGDHGHSYTAEPRLTEQAFTGKRPGHVVHHVGKTVLFSDGSGEIQIFDPSQLGGTFMPVTATRQTPSAHHGVAIKLADGTLLHTLGTEEKRVGVVALDASGKEVARNEECEGVHGEAASGDHAVSFGCHDGALVYRDGRFTKVTGPAKGGHGSIGTLVGSESSPVVLSDYSVHAADGAETPPTQVALIDTTKGTLSVSSLGASYSFRSLERGPKGEAVVLTSDGALRILDPATGKQSASIPVIGAWTEPKEWQAPRPTVRVIGERAYVTEPSSKRVFSVDLGSRSVAGTGTLAHTPNEVVGNAG